ncbi:putative F-box/LRR-repeat protein 23 [Vicia villosa]|uniref:putative F-box/LRR-repeat protein 23 n=1 Tax=Vicia villosa TaxID=3911 RepID=UPI00273B2D8F|nr:putative F-box/LRR-repeat protein 23 [Vicia villosa]
MASSSCITATEVEKESTTVPNWLELPRDVTVNILLRLNTVDIITRACQVCSLWWNICKESSMWRTIHITNVSYSRYNHVDLVKICCNAVGRSCDQLEEINIKYFGTDDLLQYISDRLVECQGLSEEGFINAVKKLPLLEELAVSLDNQSLSMDCLEIVGRHCARLKSLRYCSNSRDSFDLDDEAFAIAKTMPGLHHLKLSGDLELTQHGVLAILDGCPLLETLDLQQCCCLFISEALEKRCHDRIKDVYFPIGKYYSSEDDFLSEYSSESCEWDCHCHICYI